MNIRLHTPRLQLRPFGATDARKLHAIKSDWQVARMLRTATFPPSLDETRQWLAGHADEWAGGIAYRFAVVLGDEVIGCADVEDVADGCGDLGYFLEPAVWGRGFAREAAEAVMTFAFADLGLRRLVAGHAADNPGSGRVLEKLGFSCTGEASVWSRSRQTEIRQLRYERTAPS